MARRKYEQRLRAEAAEDTKRRIVDALYERLREAPTKPVSVEEVARLASVSRSTVYLTFESRAGLFDALARRLTEGAGCERIIEGPLQADAREHMRAGLEGGVLMFAAHRDVFRVLFSLAQLDPDTVGNMVGRAEQQRKSGIARLGRRLEEQDRLRPGVDASQAAATIWLLAGFESFDTLYTSRAMRPEAIAKLLVETAQHALLRDPPMHEELGDPPM